jgi:tetratricopeptide (TPR) repeat protein
VLLRTAKGLVGANIPARRVRLALRKLKNQLPSGRTLSALAISAEGNRIVVRDERVRWNPENGQALFNFDVSDLAEKAAPIVLREAKEKKRNQDTQSAQDWFELGYELEVTSGDEARDAYRRAIELDPKHVEAHVNLGRLLHDEEQVQAALAHYELAHSIDPENPTVSFNLGVAYEDLGRGEEAMAAYLSAISADGKYADAHYNLARLYERAGKPMAALRHFRTYRRLTQKK